MVDILAVLAGVGELRTRNGPKAWVSLNLHFLRLRVMLLMNLLFDPGIIEYLYQKQKQKFCKLRHFRNIRKYSEEDFPSPLIL
jgi:hypothetical protein